MSSRQSTVVGLAISMPLIATAFVACRFRSRSIMKTSLGAEDYLIVLSLVFCYGLSIATLTAAYEGGLGDHLQISADNKLVHPEKFVPFAQSLWVLQFCSILATGPTKMSVLFFYKRIFITKSFQKASWVGIILMATWTVAFFLVQFLNCLPLNINWRPEIGESGKCLPIVKLFWATTISDIVTDAIIVAMPWFEIQKLQMSVTRKIQIGVVFLLGAFTTGSGIARCVLSASGVVSETTDLDYTYSRSPAVYWTIIEANVGVISACLPTLRPIISQIELTTIISSMRQTLFGSSRSDSTSTPYLVDSSERLYQSKKTSTREIKSDGRGG